jgi:kynurenine formamidase
MAALSNTDEQAARAAQLASSIGNYRIVDLSHQLVVGIPTFPTHPKYFLAPYPSMGDPAEFNQLVMSDHSGTHVDSPAHFVPDHDDARRVYTSELDISSLVGRALKLDFGPFPAESHTITLDDIREWEAAHTAIEGGDIVIFNTRWGAEHWGLVPAGFDYLRGWPGISGEAARYLRDAGVKAVGIDCISIDPGDRSGDGLEAHYALLPSQVLVIENLANLDAIPPVSFFMAFPLRISGGSGSPVRAIALVPKGDDE